MRSRSALELAVLSLGAVVEGVWCGALAALLAGAAWAALAPFAAATVLVAACLARVAGGGGRDERAARILELTLVVVATGVLLVAGRAWTSPYPAWQAVIDVIYVSGLVALGIWLGRATREPDAAVGRVVRGFALLCALLVCAALAGSAPGWSAGAVVASLVAGSLLIAVARYRALADVVDEADRPSAWAWLLAVVAAVLGVIAVGALLGELLGTDAVHQLLGVLGAALRYALDGAAYVVGWAGAGLLRAIEWLLGLLNVSTTFVEPAPQAAPEFTYTSGQEDSSTLDLILTVGGALAAAVLAVAIVGLALRHIRHEPPAASAVMEEREALTSLRSAAGGRAADLGRRLHRLLARRRTPRTPAETVRHRYAELERRLARAGRPRAAGVTVREHLATVASLAAQDERRPEAQAPSPTEAAAGLAGIYEMARYSAHAIDGAQADRFDQLARGFQA